MWFLIPIAGVALAFAYISLAWKRRMRRRERGMVLGELKRFACLLEEPTTAMHLVFSGPHRFDEDRAHDTMFSARYGSDLLSFILDTSRRRIRWWILFETYAPASAGAGRTRRHEATFVEGAIPVEQIRDLLKAARGETRTPAPASEVPPESAHPPDAPVDPFEPIPSGPTAEA